MDVVISHMYPWPVGVLITVSAASLLIGAAGAWSLWRVRKALAVVPQLQERLDSLTHSMSLLTDTTESCFKALSMQFQFVQTQGVRTASPARPRGTAIEAADGSTGRKARQRRVVGAARRGESLAEIAAREDLSESEVALHLHINREAAAAETTRYGSMLS
jgi:hypothetical protein